MALVPGCTGTGINKGDFSLISIGEEWELGNQLSADIAKEMRVLAGGEVNAYITNMGQKILAQARNDTPVATQPWQFHVVDNKEINAFNIPGGHVYVYSGLVAQAESYNELAAVMGHEVSHGLARHGVENMSKQYGIMALASLVLGENPAVYQEILTNILAGGAIMKFSREAEKEADRLGVTYTYGAGIDPEGMVSFFQKLLEVRDRRPGTIEQFFSSHPLTEDRIHDVQSQIDALPQKPLMQNDAGFEDFKRRVAAASSS
jgi:predicted Zn-dependent protease